MGSCRIRNSNPLSNPLGYFLLAQGLHYIMFGVGGEVAGQKGQREPDR
jgi:hypothetical protein